MVFGSRGPLGLTGLLGGRVWLPFTQMGAFGREDRTFVRASGTMLSDARGRTLFDAISSVWTTIHGHSHAAITAAICRQAAELDHATALGASNPLAEDLARRLAELTGLPWAFFASDGASAVEAALKMSLQYWRNVGRNERTRFVHLTSSYHGDTIGAMSVSDIAVFRRNFEPVCFETLPYDALEEALRRPDVAAIVVEPLVQVAAGMRIVPHATLRGPREPLLIVEEIATGFGRTNGGAGLMFRQLLGIFGGYSVGRAIGLAASGRPEDLAMKIVYHGLAAGARAEREQERQRAKADRPRSPRRFAE